MNVSRSSLSRALVFSSVLALAGAPLAASADSGQAYDVLVSLINGDVNTLEPGDFAAQWRAAIAPRVAWPNGVGQPQGGMPAWYETASAQSRYVAPGKERIDDRQAQRATIADCATGTVTHLDLKAKTYFVTQVNRPRITPGNRPQPPATPLNNGEKSAVSVVDTELGPKVVFGYTAFGYVSKITSVTTEPNGAAKTTSAIIKLYVAGFAEPRFSCPGGIARIDATGWLGRYQAQVRGLTNRRNPNITVSSSGPPMPSTFAYFQAVQFSAIGSGSASAGSPFAGGFVVQRGNLRTIDSNDPIFSVPADFTQINPPTPPSGNRGL
jgi:hypothetical protein